MEIELKEPPTDGVTSTVFANSSDLLLVSSWDKGVRLYDARKNVLKHSYQHQAAALDTTFAADDSKGFSGGLDKNLMMCDFQTGANNILGTHDTAIKCVEYSETTGLVVSGGWDSKISLWDPRSHDPIAGSTKVTDGLKIYTMALNHNRLIVGTSQRQVYIYDVRQMAQAEQVRESSLMHQTRCIRCFPNGAGYALSSIEGRVAIEFFDPSPAVQKKKYAFKCHRKPEGKIQTLFPVNAIAFHPTHGTFGTGGCDGLVNVWDGENKKRICQYREYPTSIAALDFNYTGDLLAIAASYTYEEGEKAAPADSIFIRTVNDHEVKKKKKVPK